MKATHKQHITIRVHNTPYVVALTFESTSQREKGLEVLREMIAQAESKYVDPSNDLTDMRVAMIITDPAQDAVNQMAGSRLNREAATTSSFTKLS